jgi:hypothetical protein
MGEDGNMNAAVFVAVGLQAGGSLRIQWRERQVDVQIRTADVDRGKKINP